MESVCLYFRPVELSVCAKQVMLVLLSGRKEKSSETIRKNLRGHCSGSEVKKALGNLCDRALVIRTEVRGKNGHYYTFRAASGVSCLESGE